MSENDNNYIETDIQEDDESGKVNVDKGVMADEPSQDYGYEEYTPEPSSSDRSNRQVKRRNVVTANENVYDLSYHPGRVVSYFTHDVIVYVMEQSAHTD